MSQELDFFAYLQQQTAEKYGAVGSFDYKALPTTTLEEYKGATSVMDTPASSPAVKSSNAVEEKLSTVDEGSSAEKLISFTEKGEKLSCYRPMGDVPPGFTVSQSCKTCEYFDFERYCRKHDFPCADHYVCSDYELYEDAEYHKAYIEGYSLDLPLNSLTDEELVILAEGWTNKGNVKSDTRKKTATLSKGRFPIFDKKSAVSALKLRGKAKSPEERKKIIAAAAKYAPEEASQAKEADKKESYSAPMDDARVPSNQSLWLLALHSDDITEDISDLDTLESVYTLYEEMYTQRYGNSDGMYILSAGVSIPADVSTETVEEKKEEETVAPESLEKFSEGAGAVTSAAASGSTEVSLGGVPTMNMLYQVAESRVKARAKKEKRVFSEVEVKKEYERIKGRRNPT